MGRVRWEDLPLPVREVVAGLVGEVFSAEPSGRGVGSDLTAVLRTIDGPVFLKGSRLTGRNEVRRIEAKVQPHLPDVAPRLLGRAETEGWLLLIFEYVEGRPAVLSPGSPDLPLIGQVLSDLSTTMCPTLPVLPVERRWAPFAEPAALESLAGDTLVHTDLTAENFLIGQRVRIIDWAWPSRGAAWLDTASWTVRMIQAGHTPRQAEGWARRVPAWTQASRQALVDYARVRTALCRTASHRALLQALTDWRRHLGDHAA